MLGLTSKSWDHRMWNWFLSDAWKSETTKWMSNRETNCLLIRSSSHRIVQRITATLIILTVATKSKRCIMWRRKMKVYKRIKRKHTHSTREKKNITRLLQILITDVRVHSTFSLLNKQAFFSFCLMLSCHSTCVSFLSCSRLLVYFFFSYTLCQHATTPHYSSSGVIVLIADYYLHFT